MTQNLAVDCKHIRKDYSDGEKKASVLKDINLEVKVGELMIIVGPSGCGKTTLLSIMGGLLNSDRGSCEVYGLPVTSMNTEEKTRFRAENIGFVFQDFRLFPTLTAVENAALPLIISGVKPKLAKEKASEILPQFELQEKLTVFPASLSGGQQQRISIARAIIHHPKLILCDEPTSAIDREEGHKILTFLKKIVLQKKQTVIVVTHDSRIFHFADRIAFMDDGIIKKIKKKV